MKSVAELSRADYATSGNITRLELEFRANRSRRNFGDGDAATTNLIYCWCDGKFVHGLLWLENLFSAQSESITNASTLC